MLITLEPTQRVVLGHGLALVGKVQALWEKFHVLLALPSGPRPQLPPLLLPAVWTSDGSSLFFQGQPVWVGDTAGHQGHRPSLPATRQERARALWHSLGHPKPSPSQGRSAGSRNRCKIPVAKSQDHVLRNERRQRQGIAGSV